MQSKLRYKTIDLLSFIREPFMLLFVLIPLFEAVVLRIAVGVASDILIERLGFDLMAYGAYIQSVVLIIVPALMGSVTAFMMLDEMDYGMMPLLQILPGSLRGYLLRRFTLPLILTLIYTPLCYAITGFVDLSILQLVVVTLLLMVQSVFAASFVFANSPDKVAGLTMAKASTILMLPCFATLLDSPWTLWAARLTPYFYVTELLRVGFSIEWLLGTVLVNGIWTALFAGMMVRRIRRSHS